MTEKLLKMFNKMKKEFPKFEKLLTDYSGCWKIDYVEWINSISTSELSEDQIASLRKLNTKLVEIEKIIKTEVTKLTEIGDSRIEDSNDWVNDYEIVCCITFYLNENDHDYKEDPDLMEGHDNTLIEFSLCSKHQNWDFGIADGENHNEFHILSCISEDHPLKNEHHCYLFHKLIDTSMNWSNMLRIGFIWLDVNIVYQKFIEISKVNS